MACGQFITLSISQPRDVRRPKFIGVLITFKNRLNSSIILSFLLRGQSISLPFFQFL